MPNTKSQPPLFLTTREVADLLRVKERKVYDLAAADDIPHRRITGKLLFPADEVNAWLNGSGHQFTLVRPDVLAGSHDPLLDWAVRASQSGLATLCNGSRDGLEQFLSGSAAMTGLHLADGTDWNIKSVADAAPQNAVLVSWAVRKRGLLVAQDLVDELRSVADLKGRRVASRQPGAGAAVLLAQLLASEGLNDTDLAAPKGHSHTEIDAASAVAAGEADAALGIEAMARQFKLAFVPLVDEKFDLLIDRRSYFTNPVQRLLAFAATPDFRDKAGAFGGYDLDGLGTVRWLSP